MSDFQQKDNGILFRNEKKEDGSNHPDYTGDCTIDGKKLQMSAWLKTGKSGKKFMSFSFKPPYVKGQNMPSNDSKGKTPDPFDDLENDAAF